MASTGESKVYVYDDLDPGFSTRLLNVPNEVVENKRIYYHIEYNQSFESCTGSAAGRVSLPAPVHESFSIEREDISLQKGVKETVRIKIEPRQAKKVAKTLAAKKDVHVKTTFKFNCSDQTSHRVRNEDTIQPFR